MSHTFFITATNTNIGKTYTTLLLLKAFAKQGFRVGALKPIETGVSDTPSDGKKLLKLSQKLNPDFKNISLDDVVPVTFKLPAAPIVAKTDNSIDFYKIKKAFKKISKVCDIVFIEGAGGLLVPVEKGFFMIDFIDFFQAKTLLVTSGKLGCINDTLLSINLLNQRNIDFTWCINIKNNYKKFSKTTLPYYKGIFDKIYILQTNKKALIKKLLDA